MSIKALIVDDEELARRGLKLRLKDAEDFEIVGECRNGREALEAILELRPDVVFLDIQMPGLSGFDVIRTLQGTSELPLIVFVTAYDKYAIKAFEAHALDYLLKPIDDSRLHQALHRIRQQIDQRTAVEHRRCLVDLVTDLSGTEDIDLDEVLVKGRDAIESKYLRQLPIKDGKTTVFVEVNDIESIDAAGDYMCVHAKGQTYVLRGTMKKLEDCLDPKRFQRIHRSTIVNVGKVRRLRAHINGEYFLYLESGSEAKLSRNYRDRLKYFLPAGQA